MFEEFFGRNRRNKDDFKIWLDQMMKDYEKMFKSLEERRKEDNDWHTWRTPNGFGMSRISTNGNLNEDEMGDLMMELSKMLTPYSFDPYSNLRPSSYRRRKTFNPELEIEFLKKELEKAVEEQEYEEAAEIRDEIKKLEEDLNKDSDSETND